MMNPGRILVFGRSGQVGGALAGLLGDRAQVVDRDEADFSRPDSLTLLLERMQPAAVINASAYTAVDLAEKERELSQAINADAPGVLARWCSGRGIPFVHYSTDYVFPGMGERPWREDDEVSPLSVYGATKLEGERQVAQAGGKWLVFRTSWVFDATGKNFVNTMLRLGAEREALKVVADQFGAPTYAPHLAAGTLKALEHALAQPSFPSGIYHLCNTGVTTWHGFAEAIFNRARLEGISLKVASVEAIPSSAYPTPAKRPQNSRLNLSKAREVLGVELPSWEQGLADCFEARRGR